MYKGIASVDLVVAMGRAGLLSFFGSGGLDLDVIDDAITAIQSALGPERPYGMNLLSSPHDPELETKTIDVYLRRGVRCIEASAYIDVSPDLVRYRVTGLSSEGDRIRRAHRIVAKVSRAEVAERFMRPAPRQLVQQLVARRLVSSEQGELASRVPMADDICVEADSAGHTDRGNAYVLMPTIRTLRDRIARELRYSGDLRIGAAGGIGTPDAALAAFALGADFIVTGSINQCTVEARTSDAVKDILQGLSVHDTDYAPAGDMFEVGAKVQVAKSGLLFPARAQKLYELYQRHEGLHELDSRTRGLLEEKFFRRSLEEVWDETRAYLSARFPSQLALVERSPKQKMAQVFRWYFMHSTRLALAGQEERRVDYQIHTGPALGAFNQLVKGTASEPWRARRVAELAEQLMQGAALLVSQRLPTDEGAR